MLFACSKDEAPTISGDNPQNETLACGKVFVVEPTKGDNTENLIQAFTKAKDAGPGSVVQLAEGEFELDFIEVRDFYGSIIGAGKGKTVITPKTGLDCDVMEGNGLWKFLINFVGGNINVSNMTIKATDGTLCSNGTGLDGLILFSDYNHNYTSVDNYVKAIVNNVEFIGYKFGNWWYNCWDAMGGGCNSKETSGLSRSHVDLKVTNCTFDSFGYGTQFIGIKKGNFILGTKNNGNILSDCAEAAVFYQTVNTDISVVGNKFNISDNYYWGLDFDNYWDNTSAFVDEPQTKTPLFLIEGNEFNIAGDDSYGMWLHDHRIISHPQEDLPVLIQMKSNKFNFSAAMAFGMYIMEVKGPVFRNNKFTGNGFVGIRVTPSGYMDVPAENGLILGNNFANATFGRAAIVLSPYTINWTVIGGSMGGSVINLGTNNIITGINIHSSLEPLGQTITDNFQVIREAMKKGFKE